MAASNSSDHPDMLQHLNSTSYSESYHEESSAIFQYLREMMNPMDLDLNGQANVMVINWIEPLAAGYLAKIIINSGAVSTSIFVLSQDEGIIWSQKLKKWMSCSPRYYFTKVASIMSETFFFMINELNDVLVNFNNEEAARKAANTLSQADQDAIYDKKNAIDARQRIFRRVKDKLQNDRFISEVATFLIRDLLIRDKGDVKRVMREFATATEWLSVSGTMAVNIRTLEVCERTKEMKTMRSAAFPFTWQKDQSDEVNFSWAPTLIRQIATFDPSLEEDILVALFMCLLGVNVERAILIVFGPGKNGKSLLFSIILKSILGELHGVMPTSMLMQTPQSVHTGFESQMEGVYVALIDDPSPSAVMDVGKMKKLGNIGDGQWIRDSGAHGGGRWMDYLFLTMVLVNNKTLRFNEQLDKAEKDRIIALLLSGEFIPPAIYDTLNDEQKESNLYIREYPREEYYKPEFLQGMFNYIIVRGGGHYWARKDRGERALRMNSELLDDLIRVPSHDIVGWFDAVTTVDPDSKVSVNTLHKLYMEQEGSKIERNNFLSLIKKWVPGAKNNISRTSVNGMNNQYVIHGWRMHGELSVSSLNYDGTQRPVRIMSLAEWFHCTYEIDGNSFPFLNDIRLDYCTYLESVGLPVESEKGFSTKLSNALPELVIKKKQGRIDGAVSTKIRVWNWKRRGNAPASSSLTED